MERVRVKTMNNLPSRTQQSFANEVNINMIVAKAKARKPVMQDTRQPLYGDFSNIKTFHEQRNAIIEAENAFMTLPAAVRKKFGNDVGKLLEFVADSKNKDEAIELGLIEKVKPEIDVAGETLKTLNKLEEALKPAGSPAK